MPRGSFLIVKGMILKSKKAANNLFNMLPLRGKGKTSLVKVAIGIWNLELEREPRDCLGNGERFCRKTLYNTID